MTRTSILISVSGSNRVWTLPSNGRTQEMRRNRWIRRLGKSTFSTRNGAIERMERISKLRRRLRVTNALTKSLALLAIKSRLVSCQFTKRVNPHSSLTKMASYALKMSNLSCMEISTRIRPEQFKSAWKDARGRLTVRLMKKSISFWKENTFCSSTIKSDLIRHFTGRNRSRWKAEFDGSA